MFSNKKRLRGLSSALLAFTATVPVVAQNAEEGTGDPEAFELSPFEVTSELDRGYLATNQISGTRVRASIKDTPISLEILTSEFLTDTGATDFKDSLRYSAGIFTESFVDGSGASPASGDRSPSSSARVGDPRNNAIMIRGFNAPFQQRMGFRVGNYIGIRGGSTGQGSTGRGGVTLGSQIDMVNVDRIEIVRGPGALLYGLGVISGIANVLPKTPQSERETNIQFGIGTDDYLRASLDTTGPLLKRDDGSRLLNYRFMTAFHEEGDWTDYFLEKREYYAGQLEVYPLRDMQIFAELQAGTTRFEGLGPKFILDNQEDDPWRDPYDRPFTNEFGERNLWGRDPFVGRYEPIWDVSQWDTIAAWQMNPPDPSRADELQPLQGPFLPYSARITGPDTWYERDEVTATLKMDWAITDGLALSLGAFHTEQSVEEFAVHPFVIINSYGRINLDPTDDDSRIPASHVYQVLNPTEESPNERTVYRALGTYWTKAPIDAQSTQFKADLRYEFTTPFLFGQTATHSFLLGRQDIQDEADLPIGSPSTGQIMFDHLYTDIPEDQTYNEITASPIRLKSFYDWENPIRYQNQPLVRPASDYYTANLWYQGNYLVYHGRFMDDDLSLIAGIRQDRFQAHEERWERVDRDPTNERIGTDDAYYNFEEAIKVTTNSIGLSYALTDALNIYGVVAEGVIPNTGQRDGDGLAIEPEQTLSKEIGFKFDFFDGKISGTISYFEITRENAIWEYANAPAPGKWVGGRNPFSDPTSAFDAERLVEGAPINYGISYQLYFRDLVEGPEGEKWMEKLGLRRTRQGLLAPQSNNPRLENGELVGNPAEGIVYITQPGSMNRPDSEITEDFLPYVWVSYEQLQDDPELKAVMEQAFEDFAAGNHPEAIDPIRYVEHSEELAGLNASVNNGASVTFEEEVTGIDGQIIVTPFDSDNFQFLFSFAHIEREATSAFDLVQAADYRFPELGNIGTEYDVWVKDLGRESFGDPTDPTTLEGGIKGKSLYYGSEDTFSLWGKYTFTEGMFENLGFGLGARYIGPAQTFIPIGGEQLVANRYPTPDTPGYSIWDAAVYYTKNFEKCDLRLRLNLYNIFDKHRLYTETQYQNVDYPELTERRRTLRFINPFSVRLSATISF